MPERGFLIRYCPQCLNCRSTQGYPLPMFAKARPSIMGGLGRMIPMVTLEQRKLFTSATSGAHNVSRWAGSRFNRDIRPASPSRGLDSTTVRPAIMGDLGRTIPMITFEQMLSWILPQVDLNLQATRLNLIQSKVLQQGQDGFHWSHFTHTPANTAHFSPVVSGVNQQPSMSAILQKPHCRCETRTKANRMDTDN